MSDLTVWLGMTMVFFLLVVIFVLLFFYFIDRRENKRTKHFNTDNPNKNIHGLYDEIWHQLNGAADNLEWINKQLDKDGEDYYETDVDVRETLLLVSKACVEFNKISCIQLEEKLK